MNTKKKVKNGIYHILVFGFGLVMLYPLFWMFMSSFKESSTIFTTGRQLYREKFTLEIMRMDGKDLQVLLLVHFSKILCSFLC